MESSHCKFITQDLKYPLRLGFNNIVHEWVRNSFSIEFETWIQIRKYE